MGDPTQLHSIFCLLGEHCIPWLLVVLQSPRHNFYQQNRIHLRSCTFPDQSISLESFCSVLARKGKACPWCLSLELNFQMQVSLTVMLTKYYFGLWYEKWCSLILAYPIFASFREICEYRLVKHNKTWGFHSWGDNFPWNLHVLWSRWEFNGLVQNI